MQRSRTPNAVRLWELVKMFFDKLSNANRGAGFAFEKGRARLRA